MKKLFSNKWTWIAIVAIIIVIVVIKKKKDKADADKKSGTTGGRFSKIDKKVSQAPKMTRGSTLSAPQITT